MKTSFRNWIQLHILYLLKKFECGCAGIFNTINSIETLAQFFDNHQKIGHLEKFISINGARHYGLI